MQMKRLKLQAFRRPQQSLFGLEKLEARGYHLKRSWRENLLEGCVEKIDRCNDFIKSDIRRKVPTANALFTALNNNSAPSNCRFNLLIRQLRFEVSRKENTTVMNGREDVVSLHPKFIVPRGWCLNFIQGTYTCSCWRTSHTFTHPTPPPKNNTRWTEVLNYSVLKTLSSIARYMQELFRAFMLGFIIFSALHLFVCNFARLLSSSMWSSWCCQPGS
jgi:hypothetical protein